MPRPRRKVGYLITATDANGGEVSWSKVCKNGWLSIDFNLGAHRIKRAFWLADREARKGHTVLIERIVKRHGKRRIAAAWIIRPKVAP